MRLIRSSNLLAAFAALGPGFLALSCGDDPRAPVPEEERPSAAAEREITRDKAAPPHPPAAPPPENMAQQQQPSVARPAPAAAPAVEPGEQPVAHEGGFFIDSLVVARGVEQRQPVDPGTSFTAPEPIRLYAFVNVVNPERVDGELTVTWLAPDGKERGRVVLAFPEQPRWRTWSYYSHIGRPGRWEAIVRTADGQELGRAPFDITP